MPNNYSQMRRSVLKGTPEPGVDAKNWPPMFHSIFFSNARLSTILFYLQYYFLHLLLHIIQYNYDCITYKV